MDMRERLSLNNWFFSVPCSASVVFPSAQHVSKITLGGGLRLSRKHRKSRKGFKAQSLSFHILEVIIFCFQLGRVSPLVVTRLNCKGWWLPSSFDQQDVPMSGGGNFSSNNKLAVLLKNDGSCQVQLEAHWAAHNYYSSWICQLLLGPPLAQFSNGSKASELRGTLIF